MEYYDNSVDQLKPHADFSKQKINDLMEKELNEIGENQQKLVVQRSASQNIVKIDADFFKGFMERHGLEFKEKAQVATLKVRRFVENSFSK